MGSYSPTTELDVLVIGAGFGGCYLLHLLRKAGFKTQVVEAGSAIGGVWAWNRYPGARVDCEFPYYGFSDPAIWGTFQWKERFPADTELRAYFQHVADVWNLRKDVKLNTRITQAVYNEETARWRVESSEGEVFDCKWLIAATGTSFKQHIPEWPGREKFKGELHHSAGWPERGVALEGKRVAVIGAGSTGVQVVQEGSKVASYLTQFIRSPNFALPMRQRQIGLDEWYAYKAQIPHVFDACRRTRTGLPVLGLNKGVFDEDEHERRSHMEEAWQRGGFNWALGLYNDHTIDPKANRTVYDFWREKTLERIRDPAKQNLLAPKEPPYYISTKRPSLEQDYYESADRDNVTITDSPITSFTETGIITEDGKHHDLDVVAVCTGYDAVTGGLRTMGIKGRGGLDLDKKWAEGVETHLGMFVHGFPNFFMVYGPQAPTSLTNGPPFIEIQGEYILQVIEAQRSQALRTIDAKREAAEAWREHCLAIVEKTLLVKTDSWYMGANVPGKRREYLIYAGGIPLYKERLDAAAKDWKEFDVVKESSSIAGLADSGHEAASAARL